VNLALVGATGHCQAAHPKSYTFSFCLLVCDEREAKIRRLKNTSQCVACVYRSRLCDGEGDIDGFLVRIWFHAPGMRDEVRVIVQGGGAEAGDFRNGCSIE